MTDEPRQHDGPGAYPGPFVFARPSVWLGALALLTFGLLLVAYKGAAHFDGDPIDGALQFFNPLRRLALGQRTGRDFEVFHGPGLSYFLSPVFRGLGADIYASELIRYLLMPLALVGGYVAVFAAFTRSLSRTVVLATLALLATMALPLTTMLIPGTSVLGLRTAFPLGLVAVLALPPTRRRLVAEGLILGLIPLLSVEQGMAIGGAYVAVYSVAAFRAERPRDNVVRLLRVIGIAIGTFAALLLIIAGPSGMVRVVHYNFVDVPADQFWFFGAPPNAALDSASRLLTRPDLTIILLIGLLNAVYWLRKVARRNSRPDSATLALTVLAVFGMLSAAPLMAIWVSGYTHGLIRALLITVLLVVDARSPWGTGPGRTRPPRKWWPELTAGALLLGALMSYTHQLIDVALAPGRLFSGEFHADRTMGDRWQTAIQIAEVEVARARRTNAAPLLWSTYSGLAEASTGIVNPSRFDYLIHALGATNRAEYFDLFRRTQPAIVQTVDPRYTRYEEWLEITNWEFYRPLILGYRASVAGPWSIFWERLPTQRPEPRLVGRWDGPAAEDFAFEFPTRADTESNLFEVEIRYTTENPWRFIPVIGRLPRYLIAISDAANLLPVPLPPSRNVVRFPVVALDTGDVTLTGLTRSFLPGPALRISAVHIYRYARSPNDSLWLAAFNGATEAMRRPIEVPNDSGVPAWIRAIPPHR